LDTLLFPLVGGEVGFCPLVYYCSNVSFCAPYGVCPLEGRTHHDVFLHKFFTTFVLAMFFCRLAQNILLAERLPSFDFLLVLPFPLPPFFVIGFFSFRVCWPRCCWTPDAGDPPFLLDPPKPSHLFFYDPYLAILQVGVGAGFFSCHPNLFLPILNPDGLSLTALHPTSSAARGRTNLSPFGLPCYSFFRGSVVFYRRVKGLVTLTRQMAGGGPGAGHGNLPLRIVCFFWSHLFHCIRFFFWNVI